MTFNQNQIDELINIIDQLHIVFIANEVGRDILSDDDKKILKDSGISLDDLNKNPSIEVAFKFGLLSQAIGHKKTKDLDYNQFKNFLASGKFLPLNETEISALMSIKRQSYKDIKGLGNRISGDVQQLIIEQDKQQRSTYEKTIRNEAFKVVRNRQTVRTLVSELGHKTTDWTRDFGRIADYVMHTAFDEGRSLQIQKLSGSKATVYKQPYPGACTRCVELYLTSGFGSQPKLFTLEQLQNNGTNIGRKANEWLPIIGATHPWCRCTLEQLPDGFIWDDNKKMFVLGDVERKVKRKSKVTIEAFGKKSVI